MNPIPLVVSTASACLLAAAAQAAQPADSAVPMRDPMRPAPTAAVASRTVDAAAPTTEITPRHLMVVDGRHYLIEGGRRFGVGDLLGSARIERIDDGAVWLREAGVLRQLSLFGGVTKRPQGAGDAASSPSPAADKFSPVQKSTLPTGKRS